MKPLVLVPAVGSTAPAPPPAKQKRILVSLAAAQPTSVALRDGEVVVYRRSRSLLYQCRYKLADGSWHRQTTGKASLEHAIARACDIYDEARYRQRLGLAHQTHSFAHIAQIVLADLRRQIDAGLGKTAYHSYVSCIRRISVDGQTCRLATLSRQY